LSDIQIRPKTNDALSSKQKMLGGTSEVIAVALAPSILASYQ
jgi:hypothetical protein